VGAVAARDSDGVFIALVEALNWLAVLAGQTDLSGDIQVQQSAPGGSA
jgi:hypothetical protein